VDSGVTIEGGIFEVASGGSTGSGPVTFGFASGVLVLDASTSFTGLVAGFGGIPGLREPDLLDLRDIAFGSGTQVSFTEAVTWTGR
jgi:hypothetical protein